MKAVLKAVPAPGLELRTVADPVPEAGEVLLAVRATSMCETDRAICDWHNWAPLRRGGMAIQVHAKGFTTAKPS